MLVRRSADSGVHDLHRFDRYRFYAVRILKNVRIAPKKLESLYRGPISPGDFLL